MLMLWILYYILSITILLMELMICNMIYIPFRDLCQCRRSKLTLNPSTTNNNNDNRCRGLIEVSSYWIGLGRAGVVVCANLFVMLSSQGLTKEMNQSLNSQCQCYCVYALDFVDFGGFIFAAYGVTGLNLMFLYDWYLETKHGDHTFYLLHFPVPFWLNAAMNPDDATESLFTPNSRQRLRMKLIEDRYRDYSEEKMDEIASNQMSQSINNSLSIIHPLGCQFQNTNQEIYPKN